MERCIAGQGTDRDVDNLYADHRKRVALQEVKDFRKGIADHCKATGSQLANAPDPQHIVPIWLQFVQTIEHHGKGINALRVLITRCKEAPKLGGPDQLKASIRSWPGIAKTPPK